MARFQGNVHASSDRAASTLLVIILIVIVALAGWYLIDPTGFAAFFSNPFNLRR